MLGWNMFFEHQVARIFGAAIVALALCLAPSLADAHAGHVHAGTVEPTPVAHDLDDDFLELHAASSVSNAEARTAGTQLVASAPPGCDGLSCCTGKACCAVALAPEEPAVLGPMNGSSLSVPEPPDRSGFNPEGLRKPPKSFA
jgi:hypothetical protein